MWHSRTGQGRGVWDKVIFLIIFFSTFLNYSNLLLFFSAFRPRHCGRPRIEIDTLIYERRREARGVVVLIAGVVPVAVNEALVRASAGPVPCDQVWLSAKSRHSVA